jgi:hypothetical protein
MISSLKDRPFRLKASRFVLSDTKVKDNDNNEPEDNP